MILPPASRAEAHARLLLQELQRIKSPTEDQRRFTGRVKQALGLTTNNDLRRNAK